MNKFKKGGLVFVASQDYAYLKISLYFKDVFLKVGMGETVMLPLCLAGRVNYRNVMRCCVFRNQD